MAVSTVEMVSFVSKTRGGVIFFSTKGLRCTADMMSGGDFDGDKYRVIYNSEIMNFITKPDHPPYTADDPCIPFVAANTPVKAPATSSFSDAHSVYGAGSSSSSSHRPASKPKVIPAYYSTSSNTSPPTSSSSSSSSPLVNYNINEDFSLEERSGPFTSSSNINMRSSRSSGSTPAVDGIGIFKQKVDAPVRGMMANMSNNGSNDSSSRNNNDNGNDYCGNSNKYDNSTNINGYNSSSNNDFNKNAVVRYFSPSRPSVAVMSPTANHDQNPHPNPNSRCTQNDLPVWGNSVPTPRTLTRTVSDTPKCSNPYIPRNEDEWGLDIRGSNIFQGN